MGHIELLPTQPHGLLLNPMPDMPVLLGFILIIAYLVFLLLWTHRKPHNAID
jgi:hypothetical protein